VIVVSSVLDCLGLHRLSTPYDLLSPAIEDISGRHIAQRLVVPAEVVVVNEVSDGPLQLAGEFIRDMVHLPLDGLLVALQCSTSAKTGHFGVLASLLENDGVSSMQSR